MHRSDGLMDLPAACCYGMRRKYFEVLMRSGRISGLAFSTFSRLSSAPVAISGRPAAVAVHTGAPIAGGLVDRLKKAAPGSPETSHPS